MFPLAYKQRRQLINALRKSLASPRQLLALLIVLTYAAASLGMIVAVVLLPLPEPLRSLLLGLGGPATAEVRLQGLRGALTLTLLLLASTAAFQNPLLQIAPADVDMLFATPIPAWRVLLGRLLLNHLRTFFAGYFFWGLALAPALRLFGYQPWPLGAWAIAGLMLLFASVDQGFAYAHVALLHHNWRAAPSHRPARALAAHLQSPLVLTRLMLVLFGAAGLLLAAGLLDRALTGSWRLLGMTLGAAGGPLSGLLLPLGWAADLLFLPAHSLPPAHRGLPWPAFGALAGLLLLDVATALLLLRLVARGSAALLAEIALSPGGQSGRLGQLARAVGPNPLRWARVLWDGEDREPGAEGREQRTENREQPGRPVVCSLFSVHVAGAWSHSWRRLLELRRAPLHNLGAVLVLGLVPLAIYAPERGYSFTRLLTAIIFSTSLSTQIFNDTADHLRHANLELSAPVLRWQLLLAAMLPRLLVYWLGGLVLVGGVALRAPGAVWSDLALLAIWYPLALAPLLALRGALVFLYPAAGIPGQRDPVQAVLVLIINGVMVMLVITISLLPFGVVLALAPVLGISRAWIWPAVLFVSTTICLACWGLQAWAYGRYEPREG